MDISCYLATEGRFETAKIPEEMFLELCKNLRNNGKETVHFIERSILVDGIYIPSKGSNNSIMLIPNE